MSNPLRNHFIVFPMSHKLPARSYYDYLATAKNRLELLFESPEFSPLYFIDHWNKRQSKK
jgi:hypothetical protein